MRRAPSSTRFLVAEVDELPPGRGKTTTVAGREVTVYNREGRYVATATAALPVAGVVETTCEMPGRHFEVGPAMSPDRLQSEKLRIQVQVDAGYIYVVVES